MFVHAAQQVVLPLLIGLRFVAEPEVHAALKILLHQEQRFIGVCCGSKRGNGTSAMFLSHHFEPLVDLMESFRRTVRARGPQPRPAFHRMEAQAAFVAQPALVDVDIATADRSIDLSFGC